MEKFLTRIITPAGIAREEEVVAAILPTSMGEIDVLPGHASYTASLGTGILEIEFAPSKSPKSERFVIAGGFCNFSDGVLTILAGSLYTKEDVDPATYASEKANLQYALGQLEPGDPARERAEEDLKKIEALSRLLGDYKGRQITA